MTAQVVTATPTPQPNNSDGVTNYSSGGFSTDAGTAAAYTLTLGFTPRKIRVINLTGSGNGPIEYEVLDQMTAGHTITKTPGATNTFTVAENTASLITIGTVAAGTERTVTLSATVMATSSSFVWEAFA